jgi:hypothetical protein
LQAPVLRGRTRTVAIGALYGVLSAVFCAPLFAQPLALGVFDWDQHFFYYGAVLKNVVEYGQMPYWNPWYCGGNVMWQNPQIALLSPVYPLTAIAPLQLAMKINILLHYWIGFLGMHVLVTRAIGVTFLPAVIYIATLVTASGAPAIHLRAGHSVFLPGFYLPLQIYFFFQALRTGSWKYIFLSSATLALMVFNGGTHILPMSMAALGMFSLCAAIARRDWRPLAFAIAFGVAGLAYSAPKLLPVVHYVGGEYFWDTRNPTERPDRVTLEILRQIYLVPTQEVGARLPMQRHGWHEYGNYIGIGSALAIAIGLFGAVFLRSPRDQWFGISLAVTTAFLFLLSLGEFAAYAPANLAHHVPLFSSFRIPSRYSIPFLQFAALALAWSFRSAVTRYGFPQGARIAVAVVALGASAHLIYTNQWNLRNVFTAEPFDTSFHWMQGPRQITTLADASPYVAGSPMLRALMEDRSFFSCYESLQLSRGAGPDRPLVFDANPGERAGEIDFSPNQLTFSLNSGAAEARVVLNQNYAPGWTSSLGPITPPRQTELGVVPVPPEAAGRYAFTFQPPHLVTGLVLFNASLIVTLLFWRRRSSPVFSESIS